MRYFKHYALFVTAPDCRGFGSRGLPGLDSPPMASNAASKLAWLLRLGYMTCILSSIIIVLTVIFNVVVSYFIWWYN